MNSNDEDIDTRQERREKRTEKRKESMLKHGKNLAKIYRDAVLKRLGRKR
jgi:hypothetical protein